MGRATVTVLSFVGLMAVCTGASAQNVGGALSEVTGMSPIVNSLGGSSLAGAAAAAAGGTNSTTTTSTIGTTSG